MTTASMTASDLLPDWDSFNRDYVQHGIHQYLIVRHQPALRLFVDEGAARIGILIELPPGASVPPTPLEQVDVAHVQVGGILMLQAATSSRPLFSNFYILIQDIVAEIISGTEPLAALNACIRRWRDLLKAPSVMTEERQAGLFGELWLLKRLCRTMGVSALDAWTGPAGQAHDFRLGNREFEVKTTVGSRRVHRINGAGQLVPSPGCQLYLLSLQLADSGSGGGASLPEVVADLAKDIAGSPDAGSRFRQLLSDSGYRDEDAPFYASRRRLRTEAAVIPVQPGFPRLTPESVTLIATDFEASRIQRVEYDIDVSDLGALDGTSEFFTVLPTYQDSEADQ
ncbi:PD-(D/E)XK motif protein [Sphingosinicella sp. LY1275]|uniref:PD-(D/E)XK motif protein n=1 Tax=Sphingosinicella sp. LY1275 TaxID=3095379 RepID=UPI002ADEE8AE|nr:PD-(D/E)XK motif protein [Sphingosinicella sp. LY1275]MEA1015145.1 PD-(D/E)XK motif protein [Sphingosinicella sp. LY1275]